MNVSKAPIKLCARDNVQKRWKRRIKSSLIFIIVISFHLKYVQNCYLNTFRILIFARTYIYVYIYICIASVAPTSTSVRMRIYLFLRSTDRPVGLVLFAYAPKKIQRSRKLIWFFVIEFNYVFIIQFCSARACASKKTFLSE